MEELRKCPICTKKMVYRKGRIVCPDCGYSFSASESTVSESKPLTTEEQKFPKGSAKSSTNNKTVQKTQAVVVCVVIISIASMAVSILVSSFSYFRTANHIGEAFEISHLTDDYEYYIDYDYDQFFYPQSELYQQFVSDIFGKSCDEVTEEEYASITALHIYYYENRIDYTLNDGSLMTYVYEDGMYGQLEDLQFFTGLKILDVEEATLMAGDLDGLENLIEIHSANSPMELTDIINDYEKIQVMEITDTFFENSLEGIEYFTGLVSLSVEGRYLEDLCGIGDLKNLEELTIENGHILTEFDELADLTGLKKLSISSNQLKNLSFLKNMKNLEELTVNESQINDISLLENHIDTLKKLILSENYNIDDYRIISEMKGLTAVGIGCSYDAELPSFQKMDGLTSLSLEGVGDISVVATANNLTELILKRCSMTNLQVISDLTSIKVLRIDDSSSYIANLHPLMALENLEKLDISNITVFGNVEELLALPKLKEFDMDECRVGIDFDQIIRNENLEILRMNDITILDYSKEDENNFISSADGTVVELSQHMEMFAKFPNLQELYIAGNGIESLDFVSGLTKLRYIDITDNYVSSLVPLEQLSNLEIVWCGQNTIVEKAEFNGDVIVITSD